MKQKLVLEVLAALPPGNASVQCWCYLWY